ncbi:MAG: 3-dehydroquinate synthase [Clostridium sp.]|nr:3-dehydroquinate synthase [Clostridium sp.]MCM1398821.1 3-dehydroquinate synthase [Clostridium sp.]MCM1458547.1 3-dehydroquinate synthase [Bacteroides sp.]
MHDLTVHKDGKPIYDIVYTDSFDLLPDRLLELGYAGRKICVVSETNVASLYMDAILVSIEKCCLQAVSFVFPEGEQSKNLNVVRDLYEKLILEHFDRGDLLIALGGGVVGDLTGFAAATYLRGIDFIQIPTSLLAQVDSSIGGKTGVDFDSYKNMVGAFHMPKLVYMNLSVLGTLDKRQYHAGMGEILKHGLIKNAAYFQWLKENTTLIASRDMEAVAKMIRESNVVKKDVVEQDPTEQGDRALLNFGHTLGHAIEKYMNFQFLHGECVFIGTILACQISYDKGNITKETLDTVIDSILMYDIPRLPEDFDIEKVIAFTKNDKKMSGNKVKFILIKEIGNAYIDMNVTDEDMKMAMTNYIATVNPKL